MANDWFSFRRFTIRQDRCAMKVGTDAVILGAWTRVKHARRVLDIGTGTGLLALMTAQRNASAFIDAIEIDHMSAAQANENVLESLFSGRIKVYPVSLDGFSGGAKQEERTHYDLILCNPPYFSGSLRSPDTMRTTARHDDELTLNELISAAVLLLQPHGHLSLVLPATTSRAFLGIAASQGLFLHRRLKVIPLPGRPPKRVCMELGREEITPEEEMLVIEKGKRHQYTEEYLALTREFYL